MIHSGIGAQGRFGSGLVSVLAVATCVQMHWLDAREVGRYGRARRRCSGFGGSVSGRSFDQGEMPRHGIRCGRRSEKLCALESLTIIRISRINAARLRGVMRFFCALATLGCNLTLRQSRRKKFISWQLVSSPSAMNCASRRNASRRQPIAFAIKLSVSWKVVSQKNLKEVYPDNQYERRKINRAGPRKELSDL